MAEKQIENMDNLYMNLQLELNAARKRILYFSFSRWFVSEKTKLIRFLKTHNECFMRLPHPASSWEREAWSGKGLIKKLFLSITE